MKKISLVLMSVLLMTLLSSSAFALTISGLTFGGAEQERGVVLQADITVSHTGPENITGITITNTLGSQFNAAFSPATITRLGPGSTTATVRVNITVPNNTNAVDENGQPLINNIGTFTVTGTNETSGGQVSQNAPVTLQVASELEIKDAKVIINGIEDSVNDGDDVNDLRPGDDFCVFVEVENTFNDEDDDPEFEDAISVEAEVDDSDFDYSESDTIDDNVGPGEESDITLDCAEIDDDAEGDMTLNIWVTGVDELGARHGERFEVSLDIEREAHEVLLRGVRLTPARATTDTRSAQLVFELFNAGRRDEDNAGFTVTSEELNIDQTVGDLSMDTSDSLTRTVTLNLPTNLQEGTYPITVRAFADVTDAETDAETIELTVVRRATTTPGTGSGSTTTPPTTSPPTTTPPEIVLPPVDNGSGSSTGIFSSKLYLGLLIGGIALVVLLIVVLLVVAFRK